MRAFVDAAEFSWALGQVISAPHGSKYIPELNGVYVSVGDGRCVLAASNLESWLVTELPAHGGSFSFVLPRPDAIARAIRCFEDQLCLEYEPVEGKLVHQARVIMRCGDRTGSFLTMPGQDYPPLPEPVVGTEFSVRADILLERVKRVRYAALNPGKDLLDVRTSVQFKGRNVYALDGYRLAWDTAQDTAVPEPFMVRGDLLSGLQMFGGSEVTFHIGDRRGQITDGLTNLYFPVSPDRVYDLESAVPSSWAEEFYVWPKQFLQELAYLEQFAPRAGRLCVRMCGGQLTVDVRAEQFSTKIDVEGTSTVPVGFDLGYMKDALNQFRQEARVLIRVGSPYAPIVLTGEKRQDHALVLPVRLKPEAAAA